MRTKFWRVAYDEDRITEILASDKLPLPDLARWPSAKNKSSEKILSDLKAGDFVFLANFDAVKELGSVKVIGRILTKEQGVPTMNWKRPIPSLSLTPDTPGGVLAWRSEGIFCFDAQPVKRYKLEAITKKLFGDDLQKRHKKG